MVLAVAVLFLQFAPAAHALPDVDFASAPAVKAAAGDTNTGQPKPAPISTARTSTPSSTDSATGNAVPVAFTLASLTGDSQNGQALDTIRVPEAAPAKPVKVILPETHPRRAWLLLSIAEHGAATFDAYSTRVAVSKGARGNRSVHAALRAFACAYTARFKSAPWCWIMRRGAWSAASTVFSAALGGCRRLRPPAFSCFRAHTT